LIRKGLPFEVTAEGADSVLMQRLIEADNDPDIHGPFNTVQALMEDLNAED
jgi:DNA-damage-inducible protein J